MDTFESIAKMADDLQEKMVACRRDFHKHAETGWLEMRTSSIIARKLTEMGYEVLVGEQVCKKEARMGVPDEETLEMAYNRAVEQGADPEFVKAAKGGMTGVIGILRCGEGPTVAMRFDIDALGVFECDEERHLPAREGFASMNYGSMHACGHDGHATIGLGVAEVLMAIKDQLHGTIKLIFQPAEEGVRGAKSIVENGHLDGVDYFIGSHNATVKAGSDANMYGGSLHSLATCKYDVVFHGKAAHAGANMENGANAIIAASTAVLNLYAISRHSGGATRINVGTFHGGSGRNVVADEAKLEIELRGDTTQINDYMCERAMQILKGAAAMQGCTCDITLMGAAPSLHSDEDFAHYINDVCRDKMGMIPHRELQSGGGSEDVSYMMNRVQEQGGKASFMRNCIPFAAPGHRRDYDFDEKALAQGVKMFTGVVYDLLRQK